MPVGIHQQSPTVMPVPNMETRPFEPRTVYPYTFEDRVEAATKLAEALDHYANRPNTGKYFHVILIEMCFIIGVNSGGAVVGKVLSEALKLPCYNLLVKLGGFSSSSGNKPQHPLRQLGMKVEEPFIERLVDESNEWIDREMAQYNDKLNFEFGNLAEKTVILVDDSIVSGDIMRGAIANIVQTSQPSSIVVAAPVCLADNKHRFTAQKIVSVISPKTTGPAEFWYKLRLSASNRDLMALSSICTISADGDVVSGLPRFTN
ncbi:hypothetical protein H4219_001426 [Mycoemilia scoparia]|uniref:Phosphoribosyltransferase domain-containing protein n=1 Tax=Mycoemilia scoparia TaxID=417184 RepID=A0A9W8DW43_9FUNG|nr:hypothetical protein H4219_001426 [Mycoemilia scoparia]